MLDFWLLLFNGFEIPMNRFLQVIDNVVGRRLQVVRHAGPDCQTQKTVDSIFADSGVSAL